MMNQAIDGRQQRGLVIAATQPISRITGGAFMVPSQTDIGRKYRVTREAEGFRCGCPDFELTGKPCKHAYAVEFFLRRETKPDGTVIETRAARVTYSQPWSAYNRAQTTEKQQFCTLLKELVSSVPSPEQKRGRPQLPLSDMIFAACYKVYSTVSGRRFMSDLSAATAAGLIDKTPHYNSIFNVLDKESLTPILHQLITRAALPLKGLETDFAVDSTGFGLQNFYRHFSAKYGRDVERRDFLKVHALIGTRTNVIAAVAVTDMSVGDSPMLAPLVTEATDNFNVQRVSADKAYASKFNFELMESLGVQPFVPFKPNNTTNDSQTWNKLFHFFHLHREEFLASYHRRSNVESTFSAMKRKLGDTIRSKSPVAQKNEALMKVLSHNLICLIHEIEESGAISQFPVLTACPKKVLTAQQTLSLE